MGPFIMRAAVIGLASSWRAHCHGGGIHAAMIHHPSRHHAKTALTVPLLCEKCFEEIESVCLCPSPTNDACRCNISAGKRAWRLDVGNGQSLATDAIAIYKEESNFDETSPPCYHVALAVSGAHSKHPLWIGSLLTSRGSKRHENGTEIK